MTFAGEIIVAGKFNLPGRVRIKQLVQQLVNQLPPSICNLPCKPTRTRTFALNILHRLLYIIYYVTHNLQLPRCLFGMDKHGSQKLHVVGLKVVRELQVILREKVLTGKMPVRPSISPVHQSSVESLFCVTRMVSPFLKPRSPA